MPKQKSHSASKKRFRFTASGLLKRNKQNKNHILNKKTRKRKRNLRQGAYVNETQAKTISNMIYGQKQQEGTIMRIKRAVTALKKKRKIMKQAKGYFGAKSKLYRVAREAVMKSGQYAYVGRRLKKRDFRRLWIARINAAARLNNISYSRLMHGLKVAGIDLNRKVLADIAINDAAAFTALCEQAKAAINAQFREPSFIEGSFIKLNEIYNFFSER